MWQSNNPRPFLKRCHTANTMERRLPCNLQIEQIYLFGTFLFCFQYHMHTCCLIHFRTPTHVYIYICMSLGYENTLLVNPVPDMLLHGKKRRLEQFSKTKRLKPNVNEPILHIEPASQLPVLSCILTALMKHSILEKQLQSFDRLFNSHNTILKFSQFSWADLDIVQF